VRGRRKPALHQFSGQFLWDNVLVQERHDLVNLHGEQLNRFDRRGLRVAEDGNVLRYVYKKAAQKKDQNEGNRL
jgi:hypothetical protein